MHSLEFDLEAVFPFVKERIPGLSRADDMRAIGLRKDGDLVAGVLYEGFNPNNVWMHVAAADGARWLVRSYLQAAFAYPFLICGVNRVSGYVNASNIKARKFNTHLGFREEARLLSAAPDGGDVIIYVLWRDRCRFIRS